MSGSGFNKKITAIFAFLVIASFGLGCGVPSGNGGESGSGAPVDGVKSPSHDYSSLLNKANQNGSVRIIVILNQLGGALGAPDSAANIDSVNQLQNSFLSSIAGLNVSNIKRLRFSPFIAMEVDSAALNGIINSPLISQIEEDIPIPATLSQSGPLIGADNAWSSGYTGSGQTVAILDTGVESSHAFLSGKVVSEACYSTTSVSYGSTTVCPNGQSSQVGVGAAGIGSCYGQCDHGTHVAGIAAGLDPGGLGYSGVAKGANIIAIQVFSYFATYCSGSPCALSYTTDQLLGLEQVYSLRGSYNIAAVNMSIGGGYYSSQASCDSANTTTKAKIDQLRAVGIATVISSGNDGYTTGMSAPGCISSAISVGSTCDYSGTYCTAQDSVATYSNSASFLSILAPGSLITSSVPGGGYQSWHGTSMAAPQVTGAWAVLKQLSPSASVDSILATLQSTGVSITDSRNSVTKSRIQLDAAVGASASAQIQTPTPGSTLSGANVTFTWSTVSGATYYVWIGTSVGAYDIADSGTWQSGSSQAFTGLPTDGSTVYVRLWTTISGQYNYNDYTYTAASTGATITSPTPGSTLSGSSVTFTWSSVSGATYYLWIGSSVGTYDITHSGTWQSGTSQAFTGLPTDGSTVYVRIWTLSGGQYYSNDYTYTAASTASVITAPAPGSTLSGGNVTFTWSSVSGATYYLWIGSSVGTYDIAHSGTWQSGTSQAFTGLPTDGSTVYVRLWTLNGGQYYSNDYTYTAGP